MDASSPTFPADVDLSQILQSLAADNDFGFGMARRNDVETVLEVQKDGQGEAADEMDAIGDQDDIGDRRTVGGIAFLAGQKFSTYQTKFDTHK
jgi:hypothetical protein